MSLAQISVVNNAVAVETSGSALLLPLVSAASASAASAEADRVQTALDRVQTGLDRVQSGLYAQQSTAQGGIYSSTAAGLAAVAEGVNFWVLVNSETGARLYTKTGGVAVATAMYMVTPALLPTFVDSYGAVGDGTTDDTVAVKAAVTAAGAGGTIRFTSGKTYIIGSEITLLAGQKVDYNGATIKRAVQNKTTLTVAFSDASSGNVVLTVANTAGFRVGEDITITNAAKVRASFVADGSGKTDNPWETDVRYHRIVSKSVSSGAGTITCSGGFLKTFPIGALVVSSYFIWHIPVTSPNVHIFGGKHDGRTTDHSAAANTSLTNGWQVAGRRWEITGEIRCSGALSYIHDIEFVDVPSDCMLGFGAGSVVARCVGRNIGGNFTHVSGGDDVMIFQCKVYGANRVWLESDGGDYTQMQKYATLGHEDAAYSWSLECRRVSLAFCYADNAMSLFKPPYVTENDRINVVFNTAISCTACFSFSTYEGAGRDCTVSFNRFYSCGMWYCSRTNASAPIANAQARTKITHNYFIDCHAGASFAQMNNVFQLDFEHNTVVNNSVTVTGFLINKGEDVNIRHNTFEGFLQWGYWSGVLKRVSVRNNVFRRCKAYILNSQDIHADSRKVSFCYNEVFVANDAEINSNFVGVYACTSLIAKGNECRLEKGTTMFDVSKAGVRISENDLETATATTTRPIIFRTGSDATCFAIDNAISVAIRDDPGTATKTGNYTITYQA